MTDRKCLYLSLVQRASVSIVLAGSMLWPLAATTPNQAHAQKRSIHADYIPGFDSMTRAAQERAIKRAEEQRIRVSRNNYEKHTLRTIDKLPPDFICTGIEDTFKNGTTERTYLDAGYKKYDKDSTFHIIITAERKSPGEAGFELFYLGKENELGNNTSYGNGRRVHSGKANIVSPTQIAHFGPIKGLDLGAYRIRYWCKGSPSSKSHIIYIRELQEPFQVPKRNIRGAY